MDTPDRSHSAGTPLSTVEDSPVFNFINNLSPIKPVKSVHSVQAYTSPGFSSILSVFSSPHINLQKESRFLIRQSYSDLSKQRNPSENRDESNFCTVVSDGIKLSTSIMVARENCNLKCSLNEATVDPPDECLTLPSNLLQSVQYDCSSPDHNITPCYGTKLDLKLDISCSEVELGQYVQDGLDKRKSFFTSEIIQEKHLVDQTKEVPGCDWENLISNEVDDLLIFGESAELGGCDSQNEKLVDKDAFSLTTLSSKFMEEAVDDLQKTQPDASFGPCVENTTQDPPVIHSGEIGEKDETDDNPNIIAGTTLQNHTGISNQSWETSNGCSDCVPFDYKVDSQQQRGIRRRCLVFEVSGGSKRGSHNDSNTYSSDSLPSSERSASDNRSLTSLKAGASPSPCVLPSIGLHLNTLASTSKDRMVTQETLPSGRRIISMPCSIGPFPTRTARQKSLNMSLDVEIDMGPTGNEAQNIQILQDDASQAPELGSGEDLSQSSPKKKRRKADSSGESEACKRCNCKKSKCLKLYCECFAAGVYCIEPCSCQGCFNKPIHEETVLETRKQIESRNPLAFAPKVIRTSETVHEMGEEANKTPASARHKRGCNCKKSSCLKKYCECYQGGVGCSISCRCEGCKNAFGRKDGVVPGTEEIEIGEEEIIACEEDKPDDGLANVDAQKEKFSESTLLTTPLRICRSSVKLPFLSSGKPPRSSTLPIEYSPLLNTCQRKSEIQLPQRKFGKHVNTVPEDDTPEILRGNASPSNCVKTASPNSKRVSPPHNGIGLSPSCKGGRKLILKSIPSFPSLNSDVINECPGNQTKNCFNSSPS